MVEKGKRALTAFLVLATAILATACTLGGQQESGAPASQEGQSEGTQAEVVEAYLNKVFPEQAEIGKDNVKWGKDVDLDEPGRESLVKYLTERFASGTHDLATNMIAIEKASNSKEGKARYAVSFEGTEERYTVTREDSGWSLLGGSPDENDADSNKATGEDAFRQSIMESVPDGVTVEDIETYVGETDKTGAFNSTDAMRQFDFNNAIPLSETEKIAKLVGEDVAKRIFNDVNEYLAPSKRKVDGRINVMLDPATIKKEGGKTSFWVLTANQGDTIVLECSYEQDSGKHQITWKP